MCQQQTAVKTTTKPAPRAAFWVTRPEELPSGRVYATFGIRVGRQKDFYRAVLVEADDVECRWEVSKELPDGTFADPYTVFLSPAGKPFCTCDGYKYGGKCRHGGALAALLANR